MSKPNELHYCALVRFSKKTGKVDTTLTGLGSAMLKLWGLQNTTKSKATVVMDLVDHVQLAEYIGTADGFPDVCTNEDNMTYLLPDELYNELMEDLENA